MTTIVFETKRLEDYQNFKKELLSKFDLVDKPFKESYISDRVNIPSADISITCFTSRKVVIQSPPDSEDIETINEIAKSYFVPVKEDGQKKSFIDISSVDKEYFIGLDESGAGETFGSLYLGIAVIRREDLLEAHQSLQPHDVKQFDIKTILELNIESRKFFDRELKRYFAKEIDETNKITLLDRGYIELLLKHKDILPLSCVILDDYGVGPIFKRFMKECEQKGTTFILSHKADSSYLPPMAASIVARKARNTEIRKFGLNYGVINPETGNKIELPYGAPANPSTENWLIAYRKANPCADFPFFVRKKWSNVKKIEKLLPKRDVSYTFGCPKCGNGFGKIYIRYEKIKSCTELVCPSCASVVDKVNFRAHFKTSTIVMDTSALISRMVFKDLNTSKILEGMKFVIPSCVYEEIDTKQPNLKRGAEKEIEFLRTQEANGLIELEAADVDSLPDLSNDKKIIYVTRERGASLITYDRTQNLWSSIGSFVFYIID